MSHLEVAVEQKKKTEEEVVEQKKKKMEEVGVKKKIENSFHLEEVGINFQKKKAEVVQLNQI